MPVWAYNFNPDYPTLSPSVRVQGGPHKINCHFFLKEGKVQYCSDSTHHYAGHTVGLSALSEREIRLLQT